MISLVYYMGTCSLALFMLLLLSCTGSPFMLLLSLLILLLNGGLILLHFVSHFGWGFEFFGINSGRLCGVYTVFVLKSRIFSPLPTKLSKFLILIRCSHLCMFYFGIRKGWHLHSFNVVSHLFLNKSGLLLLV